MIGAWVAEGRNQMLKTRLGHVYDRALYLTAIRAERPVIQGRRFALDYTIDVHPLVVATANRDYADIALCHVGTPCIYGEGAYILIPSRHTAYGVGLVPVGFRARAGIAGPLQVAIGLSGGSIYFNRRVPDPGETRFNFTADGNAAILYRTQFGAIDAGFRLHHISNGNTGRVNPGMNSRLLFIGYDR